MCYCNRNWVDSRVQVPISPHPLAKLGAVDRYHSRPLANTPSMHV